MFDFIEIDNNNSNLGLNAQISIDIPKEQYITLYDLKIIEPNRDLLKMLNSSIINKYGIIPLFISENENRENIPKHLESKYWGFIENKENKKYMYIALENNLDNIILNIIQNISKYSIIALPIEKETVLNFSKLELNINKINEDVYNIKSIMKENIMYIVFFFLIVFLLILFKIYIL